MDRRIRFGVWVFAIILAGFFGISGNANAKGDCTIGNFKKEDPNVICSCNKKEDEARIKLAAEESSTLEFVGSETRPTECATAGIPLCICLKETGAQGVSAGPAQIVTEGGTRTEAAIKYCLPFNGLDRSKYEFKCDTRTNCNNLKAFFNAKIEIKNAAECGNDADKVCCAIPRESGTHALSGITEGQRGLDVGDVNALKKPPRAFVHIDPFCFTSVECTEASGDVSNWESGHDCPPKGNTPRGYCKAPEPVYELQNSIGGTKTIKGLRNFLGLMYNLAISLMIVAAALFFLWGGFKYMVASVSKQIASAKETMVNSLVGLVLGLAAYTILANLNPQLVSFKKQEIFMVNRMSFYNTVFCSDIQGVQFADAGTPFEPLPFKKDQNYSLSAEKTECGKEYFIEGGDSQSVCSGSACGKGNGVCLTCAAGVSEKCKTTSEREQACTNCRIAGRVATAKRWLPDESWAYMVCPHGSGENFEVDAEELFNYNIPHTDKNLQGSGGAGGWLTAICAEKLEMSQSEIGAFEQSCKQKGGEAKMLMLVFLDKEITADAGGALSIYEDFKKDATGASVKMSVPVALVGVAAFPVTASVGITYAGVAALYDTQDDNFYFIVGKNVCGKNVLRESLPFQQSFLSSILTTEATVIEQLLEKMKKEVPKLYDSYMQNAWTVAETIKLFQGEVIKCDIQASP